MTHSTSAVPHRAQVKCETSNLFKRKDATWHMKLKMPLAHRYAVTKPPLCKCDVLLSMSTHVQGWGNIVNARQVARILRTWCPLHWRWYNEIQKAASGTIIVGRATYPWFPLPPGPHPRPPSTQLERPATQERFSRNPFPSHHTYRVFMRSY